MKLKEYFDIQKRKKLSDFDKMEIYEQFLIKREKKSFLYRLNFYSKVIIATIIFIFIFYIIYPGFFNFNNDKQFNEVSIKQISTGLYVDLRYKFSNLNNFNGVYAKEVGKILNIKGDIFLLYSGNKVNITDKLVLDKEIYLSKNSYIKFLVDSGTYIKLIGPAKFKIEELGYIGDEKIYVLNLLEGKYIKVKSKKKSNVIVKVDDLEIDNKSSEKTDYEFKINDNKKIILNNGDDLLLKRKINKKEIVKILPSEKKIEIIDSKKLKQEFNNKNAKIVSNNIIKDKDIKNFKLTENIENIDIEIKFVPSSEQLGVLSTLVYSSFLKKIIKELVAYYFSGDIKKFDIVSNNLKTKLIKVYHEFDIDINSDVINRKLKLNKSLTVSEILFLVDNLIGNLKKNYYIPETYMSGLKKLQLWLYIIVNIKDKSRYSGIKDLNEFLDRLNLSDKYKKILLDFN